MNKIQKKRLMNLLKTMEDAAKDPKLVETFAMYKFGYFTSFLTCSFYNQPTNRDLIASDLLYERYRKKGCGTPACVAGHFAARRDLQKTFHLSTTGKCILDNKGKHNNIYKSFPEYFGITPEETIKLFGSKGCGGAVTPAQAAAYIKKFIATKELTNEQNTKKAAT